MNAHARQRETIAATGTLNLFALFHLNLAFSSIEEEQRGEVIRRCYWPLLELCEKYGPIGIEATGFTLEEIASRDPEWIAKARALVARGKIEFIGSGYAQIIGPLVPAKVTEANLRIGHEVYQSLLGTKPTLSLVNEQAYAGGLVGLYLDAGYRAILMDWDNPSAQHPEWHSETRYLPQRALSPDGRSIGLIWTNTVSFQKLQRLAHDDIGIDDYCEYLRARKAVHDRAFCIYASDAEIFDYRPGRYRTEEKLHGGEWRRLMQAFERIHAEPGFKLIAPSQALELSDRPQAGQLLRLETAACPVPVKKQRKYNLSRWAVTGRDDIAINAACERIYRGLSDGDEVGWKELCYLWSSDFRTHITDARWKKLAARLHEAENRWGVAAKPSPAIHDGTSIDARYIDIETPTLRARLDRRRGLAIQTLQFSGDAQPVIGGLLHGYFDDIALQADWYTGDCVFEAPGEPKITDLEWCEAMLSRQDNGDALVTARIETPKGPIEKTMRFCAREPRVEFDVTFHWADWGRGSLRLGHITLLPEAFDWESLFLTTHNGGKIPETFALAGQHVDQGAPVSFLVSASYGLGMTEGWAELGDARNRIRIEVERETAPLLGLLHHRRAGGSLFCQFMLSALELDETRKPDPYATGPRKFTFAIAKVLT